MDLLAQLPLECLHLILQTLAHQVDISALATLLRVNKYIASVTLPYLYRDPFQKSYHNRKTKEGHSNPSISMDRLLRMLISHYDDNEIPKVATLTLNLAAYRASIANVTATPLDYAAHIRHINLDDWAFADQSRWSLSTLTPDLWEYMYGPEFTVLCPWDQFLPEYDRFNIQHLVRQGVLRILLHRKLTWILANPILEQLQTLVIPVSDITRYLGVIDRLGRLECVQFMSDEIYGSHPADAPIATEEWSAIAQERQNKSMGSLVRFVEIHAQLFKGRLKIATCTSSSIWRWHIQSCPADVQFKILQLLPPLLKPKTFDTHNVEQFAAHPLTTDLGQVENIYLAPLFGTPHFGTLLDRLGDIRQFLQRCRSAKRLHLVSLGKGTFKWAVEEKRMAMEGMGGNTLNYGGQGPLSLLDNGRPACLLHGLIALEDVWINNIRDGSTEEVDDVAIAFSQTLTCLKGTSAMYAPVIPPAFYFGRGWVDMPVLDRLSLRSSFARMVVDRELFVHCPNLRYVVLTDNTSDYRCQDIVPSLPARLSRLAILKLYGWSALSFHPDTFYSTSELRHLEVLMMPVFNNIVPQGLYYIPPIEELNQSYNIHNDNDGDESGATGSATTSSTLEETPQITRPRWTWDWQLPHLTQLRLSGEFAYLFEFRMLRGCPVLEIFHLEMATPGQTHTRTLSMADLVYPSNGNNSSIDSIGGDDGDDGNDDANSSSHQQPLLPTTISTTPALGRIILPALTQLQLTGSWIIEDNFLFDLLVLTFPKLEHVILQGSTSFTLRGLLDLVRALPVPWKQLHVLQPVPPREQWAVLGLRASTEETDERQVLPMKLLFHMSMFNQYSVLRDPSEF
ncbi:hypothetical protein BKA57DRAFT_474201 [Linnemannia elongata]|nr:hypothetical protein BKA57DRAFT_474201 [Linnemannia elongata]